MRKNIVFLAFIVVLSSKVYANDYYFYYLSGGSIVPAENNNTTVEMVEESIYIELFDCYYRISVDFIFLNNGVTEELLVGFPYLSESSRHGRGNSTIYNFQTWVNDILVEHENLPINQSFDGEMEMNVNYAYTKKVLFPSNTITKTKVEYYSGYGINGSFYTALYFYGSGKGWYNDIGKMSIIIKNNTDRWIYGINMPEIYEFGTDRPRIDLQDKIQWDNDILKITLDNIDPEENDILEVQINRPMFNIGMNFRSLPYSFQYRNKMLSNGDIIFLNKSQLRILRNLFYAFYGYNFRDSYLREYFSREDWYIINMNFTENMLTEIERENIRIIIEEEDRR